MDWGGAWVPPRQENWAQGRASLSVREFLPYLSGRFSELVRTDVVGASSFPFLCFPSLFLNTSYGVWCLVYSKLVLECRKGNFRLDILTNMRSWILTSIQRLAETSDYFALRRLECILQV